MALTDIIPSRTRRLRAAGLAVLAALLAAPACAWEAETRIEHYRITGATGAELYQSIGAHGPKLGLGRVIALTRFKLTWKRDYQRRGEACVLASAVPRLVITHVLPRPARPPTGALAGSWARFIDGVSAHERVHGDHIIAMVRAIEAASVGLSVENDPGCTAIREALKKRLVVLSDEQRTKSRDFDRIELGEGGNVHQLVLGLVNGP